MFHVCMYASFWLPSHCCRCRCCYNSFVYRKFVILLVSCAILHNHFVVDYFRCNQKYHRTAAITVKGLQQRMCVRISSFFFWPLICNIFEEGNRWLQFSCVFNGFVIPQGPSFSPFQIVVIIVFVL